MPNSKNAPAVRHGYSGGSHAVGPVGGPNWLAKPWPEAMDAAIRPISQPNPKFSSVGLILYVWPMMIQERRRRNAMPTIQTCDVRILDQTLRNEKQFTCAASAPDLDSMLRLFVAEPLGDSKRSPNSTK